MKIALFYFYDFILFYLLNNMDFFYYILFEDMAKWLRLIFTVTKYIKTFVY